MKLVLALALAAAVVDAQPKVQSKPTTFEVADVRLSPPGTRFEADFQHGKATVHGVSMKQLIAVAYNVHDSWVLGGPAWLSTERYDIIAKAPPDSTDKELALMLQPLLAERFKLELHLEQRPMSVFGMIAGKGGPKLQASSGGADAKSTCRLQPAQDRKDGQPLRGWSCQNTTMAELAESLPNIAPAFVDRPVVDLTELTGRYDFVLEWSPRRGGRAAAMQGDAPAGVAGGQAPAVALEPEGITIFTSMEKQLGLKLEQRKHSMTVVVVDKVERTPTEN